MKKSVIRQLLIGVVLLVAVIALVSAAVVLAFQSERTALGGLGRLETMIDGAGDLAAGAAALSDPGIDVRRKLAAMGDAEAALEDAWVRELDVIRSAGNRDGLQARVEEGRLLLFEDLRDRYNRMMAAYGKDGGMAEELKRYREGAADLLQALRGIRGNSMATQETSVTRALLVFLLFTLFGTLTVGLLVFATLLRMLRDFGRLLSYGRGASGGGAAEAPDFQRNDELGELLDHLKAMRAAQGTVHQMRDASERMLHEQKSAQEGALRLNGLVTDQAAALGETSRGFSEATDHFRMVAENAAAALEAAEESSKGIEKSLEKIGDGISRARTLEQTTAEIEEVVTSIGDVADQTELLSLNAAIEAAHAGESGKGFAVVSQQVRKLADKSARQASEIGDLIQIVVSTVRANTNDARQFSDVMDSLKASFARMKGALGRINDLIQGGKGSITKVDQAIAIAQDLVEKGAQTAQGMTAMQKTLVQETDALVHGAPHDRLPGGDGGGVKPALPPWKRQPASLPGPSAVGTPATGKLLPAGEETEAREAPAREAIAAQSDEKADSGPEKEGPSASNDGLEELEAVEE